MSQFNIEFHQTEHTWKPGQLISGEVTWKDLDPESESIEIRLIWFTRGKGDRDFEVIHAKSVDRPEVAGGEPFEFPAPNWPASFSGKLLSLIWAIEVICFPSRTAENHEIVISPTGQPLSTRSASPESAGGA